MDDQLTFEAPDHGRELFEAWMQVANGFSYEAVIAAAQNVIVNALRQKHAYAKDAEREFDQGAYRAKHLLLNEHYDALGRRRQGMFAFPQHIHMG